MVTQTPNYGFNKPGVNDPVDANIWGNETNANWDTLDTDLKAVSDVADAAAATSPEPGDVTWSWRTAKTGWVIAQGTIGNASSGATNRANADTEDLFTVLWTNLADTEAPVSGGRGVSASADFAANKTIGLPDARGRALVGRDDMGGTAANRITNAIAGFIGTVLGAFGGDQNVQQHTHTASVTDPGHTHDANATYGAAANNPSGAAVSQNTSVSPRLVTKSSTTGITVSNANFGAGSSQNVQPTLICNLFYKL